LCLHLSPTREQATASPFPLIQHRQEITTSMDSLAVSKEAGRAALQLSRSHSQLEVTLSKSELKRLIPNAPSVVQPERVTLSLALRSANARVEHIRPARCFRLPLGVTKLCATVRIGRAQISGRTVDADHLTFRQVKILLVATAPSVELSRSKFAHLLEKPKIPHVVILPPHFIPLLF